MSDLLGGRTQAVTRSVGFLTFAICPIICFFLWGVLVAVVALAVLLPVPLLYWVVSEKPSKQRSDRLVFMFFILSLPGCCMAVLVCTLAYLRSPAPLSLGLMLALSPVYWFLLLFVAIQVIAIYGIVFKKGQTPPASGVCSTLAIVVSFPATLVSLLVGGFLHPSAHVPKTFQMLVSNAVFDAITLSVTFVLLAWAMRRASLVRLPLAIVADVMLSAVFACCSLYFGLLGTQNSLGIAQVASVLLARSPDGTGLELGPYFWAMHTTFLPTVAYLSLILLAWLGKATLTPVAWLLGKGQESKNPLKLTMALCTLVSAIFWATAYGLGAVEEAVEEHAPKQFVSMKVD
ncbi:MAG: hypothetical protein GY906_11735 [bacterium]|nr:hypothetical protein [bacterium]